ncbi:hypothetical protein [Sphingomonas sp. GB1N7]|uniref:hypothetical protein n=1 Tax=Parasphingomonas caseinilytica TaxID=3096158 RepID=UPI002FC729ED
MADVTGSNKRRVQVRARRKDGWTKSKRAIFLNVLAATCNVRASAQAAGKTEQTARALRHRDGEFSVLWEEALEAGYERLETELLARALGQVASGNNPAADEIAAAETPTYAFDPALAIRVLQLRGDRGRGVGQGSGQGSGRGSGRAMKPRMTQGEVDAALLARIDALAARKA